MLFPRRTLLALVTISVLVSACGQGAAPAAPTTAPAAAPAATGQVKTVKIGFAAPLTGDSAQYGLEQRRGAELAIEQLNQNNAVPGYKFELVAEDDKADPKEAANVAQKFVSANDITAIIGHFTSSATLAAAPIYQKAGIPMITATGSHADITKTGNFIFRLTPISKAEMTAVADWAKDMGAKRVATIGRNDDYGRSQNEYFAARAKENGAEVLANEVVNAAEKDFKPVITKVRALNPDLVQLGLFAPEASLFLQQAKEMGWAVPCISGAALFTPQVVQLAGDAAEGLLVVSTFHLDDPRPEVQAFAKDYKAKYNQDASKFAAHTYDAARLIADAVKRGGSSDPAKVRDALASTKGFSGVIGSITYDQDREVSINLVRVVIKNGQFVLWHKS